MSKEPTKEFPEKEAAIEKYLTIQCAKRGWDCWKLTVPAKKGVPDRFIMAEKGVSAFVEVKRPGGIIAPLQARIISRLSKKGFMVFVVDSRAEVESVMLAINQRVSDATRA